MSVYPSKSIHFIRASFIHECPWCPRPSLGTPRVPHFLDDVQRPIVGRRGSGDIHFGQVDRHFPDIRQVEGPRRIGGALHDGVVQQLFPFAHSDGAFAHTVDPFDASAHFHCLDIPPSHGYPLSKLDSPNFRLRLAFLTWERAPRVPRPTLHRHRARTFILCYRQLL